MNFRALDAYLDTFYAEKNIPGVGCAVTYEGEVIHTHCAGWANIEEDEKFATDTLFNLYSATKLSTVSATMRLWEKGKLSIEDKAAKYLPELAEMKVLLPDGSIEKAKNAITIENLLSMSGGFTYNGDCAALKALVQRTDGDPTTREVIKALATEPLIFEPGTRFKYSFCHDVLGALLEVVCDMPFDDVLNSEVFESLGMVDTGFTLREEQRSRMAMEYHGFDAKTGKARQNIYREGYDMNLGKKYRSGGGGLMSTVRDYALLTAALSNNGETHDGYVFLKPETIKAMQTNRLTDEGTRDFAAFGGWSKDGYGYGLGVRTLLDRERNNSLSANGEFGWDGMLGAYIVCDPVNRFGIFYIQHEGGSHWWEYHGTIKNTAYAALIGRE